MAYVYDESTLTQFVYVNGILDNSNSPRGPYKGAVGDLTIGTKRCLYAIEYLGWLYRSSHIFCQSKKVNEMESFLEDMIMRDVYLVVLRKCYEMQR